MVLAGAAKWGSTLPARELKELWGSPGERQGGAVTWPGALHDPLLWVPVHRADLSVCPLPGDRQACMKAKRDWHLIRPTRGLACCLSTTLAPCLSRSHTRLRPSSPSPSLSFVHVEKSAPAGRLAPQWSVSWWTEAREGLQALFSLLHLTRSLWMSQTGTDHKQGHCVEVLGRSLLPTMGLPE